MRTEGNPTEIRESCFSKMNDLQNQNSYDFVPKSVYNEKWHLENKCLFHNQHFSEGEKCTKRPLSSNFCSHSEHKLKLKHDGNTFKQKSGDWKNDQDLSRRSSPKNITYDFESYDRKSEDPYSFSDFDRRIRWDQIYFTSTNNFASNLLHDVYNKVENWIDGVTKKNSSKNFLQNFREYLVNYQESCGVPRTEYSFSALMGIMGQATGRCLLALLYVMLNIVPVVEVFLYILRFVLDKTVIIKNSKDFRQWVIQCIVFTTELISVYTCLIFIFGFIILPIIQMVIGIVGNILLCN